MKRYQGQSGQFLWGSSGIVLRKHESDESLKKDSRNSKNTREMSWNATRDSQDSFYEVHLELPVLSLYAPICHNIPLYTPMYTDTSLYTTIYEHPVYKEGVAVPSMHEESPCVWLCVSVCVGLCVVVFDNVRLCVIVVKHLGAGLSA